MRNNFEKIVDTFLEIARIPRPSHHEEQIGAYLYDWAKERGLAVERDALGDIIIEKSASAGYEAAPTVILQAHMDMVCVAADGVAFDGQKDPIHVLRNGNILTADGTSLGADDGIGIAMALYFLDSKDLRHGPLRAIFTVNEEDGMASVGMDARYLTGDYLINLDWEVAGSLCNSCAGGDFYRFTRPADWVSAPADSKTLTLRLHGLRGGHSGVGINQGCANAITTLATVLADVRQQGLSYQLASFEGGQAPNAIPKSAAVTLACEDADRIAALIRDYFKGFAAAFAPIEPDFQYELIVKDPAPQRVLDAPAGSALIDLLASAPCNVHTMSPFVSGLVESSSNIGTITTTDTLEVVEFVRSSVDYYARQLGIISQALADRCGFVLHHDVHVPGWAVRSNSKLVALACQEYFRLTGKEMLVQPIHAGVECGAFAIKNPALDMIAIGPTLLYVHTPDERCNLEDVYITAELVAAILDKLAAAHKDSAGRDKFFAVCADVQKDLYQKEKGTLSDVFSSLVRPVRFERMAYRVGVCHSIQLSYGRKSCLSGLFIISLISSHVKKIFGKKIVKKVDMQPLLLYNMRNVKKFSIGAYNNL